MIDILDDVSKITTITKSTLQSLTDKEVLCISHAILESVLDFENSSCIDIGIGTLYIEWDNDEIRYKFIPSKQLENKIVNAINNKESALVECTEKTLKNRIMSTYKDLF